MLYEKEQIATLSFETGLYSLSLKGGHLLKEIGVNWVEIDFDMKTNTLFNPGINNADPNIIPKDEVVILRNNKVVGVGKAVLNGKDMVKSTKGVGVRIRHRFK